MVTETREPPSWAKDSAGHNRRVLLVAIAAAAAIGCGLVVAKRLGGHAAQDAARDIAIEADDRSFCSRFGAGPDTARYPECRAGLNEIRQRHQQRSADFFF
jgi:hypothetical protein